MTEPTPRGIVDCYIRNSSALQEGNWRADRQREVLPQLCERYGYSWALCDEQGTSGEHLANRPVMQGILARITAGQRAGIACVSFDRLSRDIDLIDGLVLWQTCKEAGAVIITPDKLWIPGDDNDDDSAFIQFWLAGRNKRQQLNNLYEGLVQRAEHDALIRGRTPFGYRRRTEEYVDSRGRLRTRRVLEVDEEVRPVVRSIFLQYPNRTARSLVQELNGKGKDDAT